VPFKSLSRPGHRKCPECKFAMIVVGGFKLAPEKKTYECLQCGISKSLANLKKRIVRLRKMAPARGALSPSCSGRCAEGGPRRASIKS
jgi:hypothetical protein